ncbi:TRAP transporter small permease subunit [Roseibium limicola]|uniref:TRAP transporter small permease subunit n=1 Tax=Roseibium limicola TaxID=2816037 RepID=UPI002F41C640
MTVKPHERGAPRSGRPAITLSRLWAALVDGLAALGTALICVLMMIICSDILARNALGASLPLVSELGALLLVMIVALQLAATVRADRLARTEIFYTGFRAAWPRAGALLSALFNLTGAAVIGGMAWATIRIFGKDFASGEYIGVTGIATFPTWPFRALILAGMAIAALQFVVLAFADLKTIFAPQGRKGKP